MSIGPEGALADRERQPRRVLRDRDQQRRGQLPFSCGNLVRGTIALRRARLCADAYLEGTDSGDRSGVVKRFEYKHEITRRRQKTVVQTNANVDTKQTRECRGTQISRSSTLRPREARKRQRSNPRCIPSLVPETEKGLPGGLTYPPCCRTECGRKTWARL